MSGLGSSFIQSNSVIDSLKDVEGFQYGVLQGAASSSGVIAPANSANTVQIINCSPCPLKVTYTLQPPSTDKSGVSPETVTKEIVYKPGEAPTVTFGSDVIVDVTLEEAVQTPMTGVTPDTGSAINTNATQDLVAHVRFLNC